MSNPSKPYIEVLVEPQLEKRRGESSSSTQWEWEEASLQGFHKFAYYNEGSGLRVKEEPPDSRSGKHQDPRNQVVVFGFEPESALEAQNLIDRYRAFEHPLFAVTSPKTFNQPRFRSILTANNIGYLVEDLNDFKVDHLRSWLVDLTKDLPNLVAFPGAAPIEAAVDPLDIGVRVRDPATGRLDAKKLSKLLGMSMTDLAKLCGVSKQALGQRPASANIQDKLQPLEEVAEGLAWCGGNEGKFRAWLKRPNRDFPKVKGKVPSPMDLILADHADVVAAKVRNLLTGHPA